MSRNRNVDLLIIIFILLVVPFFFQIYKIMAKRPTMVSHVWIPVEAVTYVEPEIAGLIKSGDIACDKVGNPEGKLIRVLRRGRAFIDELHKCRIPVYLAFELSCTKSMEGEPWYYRRGPLLITLGEPFRFVTAKYNIRCHPIKIENLETRITDGP